MGRIKKLKFFLGFDDNTIRTEKAKNKKGGLNFKGFLEKQKSKGGKTMVKKIAMLGIMGIVLTSCGTTNPVAPLQGDTGPKVADAIRQMRALTMPIIISENNQSSILAVPGIKVADGTGGFSAVLGYAKYPGFEKDGYTALPAQFYEEDGSITFVNFSFSNDQVVFHSFNTKGSKPQTFHGMVVVINQ